MKQDQWIDSNIHQQKHKKKQQTKGNEILLIRQILQSLVCVRSLASDRLVSSVHFFLCV